MKTYKKIDLYFMGDYYASTNWSKTCKDAIQNLINRLEETKHKLGGLSSLDEHILKNKSGLKAKFSKD